MKRSTEEFVQSIFGIFGLTATRKFPFVRPGFRYSPPTGPSTYLDSKYFAPTVLTVPAEKPEQGRGKLHAIWHETPGGHKWLHYFESYEEILTSLGSRPIRMLEIGVYKGSSIRMWRRFLDPQSTIVGLDIDPACQRFEIADQNLHIRIGDQSDPEFLRAVVREFGPFDLILDDGSHRCSHMVTSFNQLFLEGLKSPGVYVAEDTHTNYWTHYRDQRYSFMDLAKDLVDVMHHPYFRHQAGAYFRKGDPDRVSSLSVPRIATEIEEISFRDSLVVIRKRTRKSPPVSEHL